MYCILVIIHVAVICKYHTLLIGETVHQFDFIPTMFCGCLQTVRLRCTETRRYATITSTAIPATSTTTTSDGRSLVLTFLSWKCNGWCSPTLFYGTDQGAVFLTVGRSYVRNDVAHSTLLDRAGACSYENLPKYRSYRVSNTAPRGPLH